MDLYQEKLLALSIDDLLLVNWCVLQYCYFVRLAGHQSWNQQEHDSIWLKLYLGSGLFNTNDGAGSNPFHKKKGKHEVRSCIEEKSDAGL